MPFFLTTNNTCRCSNLLFCIAWMKQLQMNSAVDLCLSSWYFWYFIDYLSLLPLILGCCLYVSRDFPAASGRTSVISESFSYLCTFASIFHHMRRYYRTNSASLSGIPSLINFPFVYNLYFICLD